MVMAISVTGLKPRRRKPRLRPMSDADYERGEREIWEHASEQTWPGVRCKKRLRGTPEDREGM